MLIFLFLCFAFRGGRRQGFAALPQPALLQRLSGSRPPTDHQRQPLPPHYSLWVHTSLSLLILPPDLCQPTSISLTLLFDLPIAVCLYLSVLLSFHLFFKKKKNIVRFPPPSSSSSSVSWSLSILVFPPVGHCRYIFSSHTHTHYFSLRLLLLLSLNRPAAELSAWGFHGNHSLVSRLALPWRPTPFSTH